MYGPQWLDFLKENILKFNTYKYKKKVFLFSKVEIIHCLLFCFQRFVTFSVLKTLFNLSLIQLVSEHFEHSPNLK